MTAVWQLKLNHTDKLVLLALADNASDEGICWPSITTLAKKTCLSVRGVQAAIARLNNEKYLKVTFRKKSNRDNQSNLYLLTVPLPQPKHPLPHTVHQAPARRAPPLPQGVHPEPSLRTIIEPSINQEGFLQASRLIKIRYVPSIEIAQKLLDITPGWDQNMLVEKYNSWREDNHMPSAKNPDAAFMGWARKFTKGQRPR